jgi:hypothetical protein
VRDCRQRRQQCRCEVTAARESLIGGRRNKQRQRTAYKGAPA